VESLGGYHEGALSTRVLASALFSGILCLVAILERVQRQLKENEGARWWASNGRDVLNLFNFGVLAYGLVLLGFFGPLVLLLSALMVVLLTAVQGLFRQSGSADLASMLFTLAVGLPPLLFPRQLTEVAREALTRLAP
jgi:hypothetical protein